MGRRERLDPKAATNEGERQLREILLRQSYGQIARKAHVDESAIRHYARARRLPSFELRPKLKELFGIPEEAWEEPASLDVYAREPATKRRDPPPTKPRPRARPKR